MYKYDAELDSEGGLNLGGLNMGGLNMGGYEQLSGRSAFLCSMGRQSGEETYRRQGV